MSTSNNNSKVKRIQQDKNIEMPNYNRIKRLQQEHENNYKDMQKLLSSLFNTKRPQKNEFYEYTISILNSIPYKYYSHLSNQL